MRPAVSRLTTMSPNSCGVVSRPSVCTSSWRAAPPAPNGGSPTEPAATWTLWERSAPTTSSTVMLRAAALSGSIQIRIA